jgi:hypothetical protein
MSIRLSRSRLPATLRRAVLSIACVAAAVATTSATYPAAAQDDRARPAPAAAIVALPPSAESTTNDETPTGLLPVAAATAATASATPDGMSEPHWAAPAPLIAGGGCSDRVDSGFRWTQDACITWSNDQMVGQSHIIFLTGFNRDHVQSCTLKGTIVSSYGTHTTHTADCTSAAHQGMTLTWTRSLGPGRQAGDRYSWHSCMIVKTGITYDSCAGPHPASPWLTL